MPAVLSKFASIMKHLLAVEFYGCLSVDYILQLSFCTLPFHVVLLFCQVWSCIPYRIGYNDNSSCSSSSSSSSSSSNNNNNNSTKFIKRHNVCRLQRC